jgi:hypothetical protein
MIPPRCHRPGSERHRARKQAVSHESAGLVGARGLARDVAQELQELGLLAEGGSGPRRAVRAVPVVSAHDLDGELDVAGDLGPARAWRWSGSPIAAAAPWSPSYAGRAALLAVVSGRGGVPALRRSTSTCSPNWSPSRWWRRWSPR